MAFNKRQGRQVIDYVKYEQAAGVRMDPGPHIGIVQHVVDSTRTGRLIVFLPHLGGNPNNIDNCRIVSYASPFYGETNLQVDAANNPNISNTFEKVRHSYGMWFTPPDVGIKVLVVFETGDTNNGYWFACIPGTGEHTTTGSMGGSKVGQTENDAEVNNLITENDAKYVPTVDYNSANYTKMNTPGMHATKRPPHKTQTAILSEQGLLGDDQRGINNSSTNRESPSCVFGITTPGRPYKDQTTDRLLKKTTATPSTTPPPAAEKVDSGRKGGHSFIMDDGDVYGESRMLRLRTAAGHQIMMHDTEGFVYISNSTGTNWIELTNDGNMYVYSSKDIAFRSGKDTTFKVDGNFNIEVDGDMHVKVKNHMQVENKTRIDITEENHTIEIGKDYQIKTIGDVNFDTENFSARSNNDISFKAIDRFIKDKNDADKAIIIDPPNRLSTTDLNDASATITHNGTVWKYSKPSKHTSNTILSIITTHEPFGGRKGHTMPIIGGKPASGPPKINV